MNGGLIIFLQIIALLGTAGATILLAGVASGALLMGRGRIAALSAAAAAALPATYAGLLLAASAVSRTTVLAPGSEKYFCEIDCHLAYAVTAAIREPVISTPEGRVTAQGVYYLVTVRTRFDASTISPGRPRDAALTPNPRAIWLVDGAGHRHAPSAAGMEALARAGGGGSPITQALVPGEAYTTTFVFDVPGDTKEPRLLFTDGSPETRFLIGHEVSPCHAKVLFELPSVSSLSSRSSRAA
jgi:hypothetical protein